MSQDKDLDTSICNGTSRLSSTFQYQYIVNIDYKYLLQNYDKKHGWRQKKKKKEGFRIKPYTIDRRPRVFKKGKLGVSGNPERNIP